MYHSTPYSTLIGSIQNTDRLGKELAEIAIQTRTDKVPVLQNNPDGVIPYFLTGINTPEREAPIFMHPLLKRNVVGKDYLFMDVRPFVKCGDGGSKEIIEGSVYVSRSQDYEFAKLRMGMTLQWLADVEDIRNISNYPGIIYSLVIASSLERTFLLDPSEVSRVQIAAYTYWQTLFFAKQELADESTWKRLVANVITSTKFPAEVVFEITEGFRDVEGFDDFAVRLSQVAGTVKLQRLSAATLLTTLSGIWMGYQQKDLIAVSLEHPPTWNVLIYTSVKDRGYKNTVISNTIERTKRRYQGSEEFVKSVDTIMAGYAIEKKLDIYHRLKTHAKLSGAENG